METKLPSLRLRRFLQTQGILFSIGTLICLTLWALRIPTSFLPIMVNSVCIGNVLSFAMEYAGPFYDRFNPPWNWVVYLPLLAAVSVVGILFSAGGLYLMTNSG
jgi:hypothetical protein